MSNTAMESGGNIELEDVLFYLKNSTISKGTASKGNGGAVMLHWSMENRRSNCFLN